MIAQDLTKFTLVLVILGIVLAIAIFRPQVFRSPSIEPAEELEPGGLVDVQSKPGLGQSEEATLSQDDLHAREQELDQREAALEEQLASLQTQEEHLASQIGLLNEKEDAIAESLAAIQAGEEQLAREWENLQAEQTRLAQGWEDLQAGQARLTQEWEDLQAERGRLDGEWARLREQRISLTIQEQKLQGFRRWSVVAVVVSGLLAVASVLALLALTRQGQRERVTQRGWSTKVTAAPTFSDNGRDRERVRHRR